MEAMWYRGRSLVMVGLLASVAGASGLACMQRSAPAEASKPSDEKREESEASAAPPPVAASPTEAAASADDGAGKAKGTGGMPRKARPLDAPGMPAFAAPPSQEGGNFAGQGAGMRAPSPISPPGFDQPAAPALIPIDPNGRFATTYRPGGSHLSAFESAVSRGIIPAADRDIVSDVGARYSATMDAPKGKAMAFRADFERGKLAPNGGPFHVRIALRSTAEKPTERPHLSVHLVLDISGSMAGESITRAREAARSLVDKLAPTDDFSLVTFSSDATVLVPDGPVGPRRESIKKSIAEVHENGGTNIGRGLELGYAQAAVKTIPEDAVRVVLLLSDGHANIGITAQDKLSKLALDAFQRGVQTSSFGLGPDYDGALMSSIAEDGAGGYYYLRDAEQIAPALGAEIDQRLNPVATAVEVRVRLKKDVSLLRVYGSRRLSQSEAARVRVQEVSADSQANKRDHIAADRQDDTEGGMRFFIPAFAPDDSHALLLQLSLPPGVGSKGIASIEIKYKDRVSKKNVADEVPLSISYADSDAASGATVDPSVARTVQGFGAGEALASAASMIASGNRPGAVTLLAEREAILRKASETLGEPLFLKDADRLARLRTHAGADTGVGDPLVLAMLLETAGRAHLH
jgi:Ca-activated chloride channel family protein